MTDQAIRHVFVYGTLLPGEQYWYVLEPWVTDAGTLDTVPGLLFDTGLGWPAARFGPEAGDTPPPPVVGRVFELRPDRVDAALAALDALEDVDGGMYERIVVTTGRGVRAWAYHSANSPHHAPIDSGDWIDHRDGA